MAKAVSSTPNTEREPTQSGSRGNGRIDAPRDEGRIDLSAPSNGFDAEIEREAYELYRERGSVDGHDVDDWLEAERRVRQRRDASFGGPVS